MSDDPSPASAQVAYQALFDPRPVLWVVGADYANRADMLFENTPCRDLDQVAATVRGAAERGATHIRVRVFVEQSASMPTPELGARPQAREPKSGTSEEAARRIVDAARDEACLSA